MQGRRPFRDWPRATLFAVVRSAFHGGGILFSSRSPREVYRWRRRHHDGCFDGTGCESYAASYDGGLTWFEAEIEWHSRGVGFRSNRVYNYCDGDYYVTVRDLYEPIRPAVEQLGRRDRYLAAARPAL